MTSPKISIVVPSYNKAKYISQTLESIVNQEYSNFEVIVQDGMSTDGSIEIIKKFAAKYPRVIKWESKKDKGQLDAINIGLKKATGDIMAYINADDTYTKGTFSEIVKLYMKNPHAMWFAGRGIVVDENGREIMKLVSLYKNLLLRFNGYSFLLITNYLMQPSVFFTKEAYKKHGPFTGTAAFVMEYDLWLKFGKNQMPVLTNSVLSKFRIEPETKTKKGFNKLLAEDWKIVKRYTRNPLILLLHSLHNSGRTLVEKFT